MAKGFKKTAERYSSELKGTLTQYVFEKTGTEVCHVNTGERNKLFAVAFKTTPQDDTGVFHILEHCVLSGSEKYPVKEPFMELMKGSLNTYLNAATFSDKTLFPVSSINLKDFKNLVAVYLDAVFSPLVLKEPRIFMQEGWHLEKKRGRPRFNGVVYNEMKGAMSDPDDELTEKMMSCLFPDNCYGKVAGGDPVHIPDLTYEKLKETYTAFYHPSNALIYLDGEMPVDEILEQIGEYLGRYEMAQSPAVYRKQAPVSSFNSCSYSSEGDEDNSNRVVIGKIICDCDDLFTTAAATILCDALFGTNESPLKRSLMDKQLIGDCSVAADDGVFQPHMIVDFRKVPAGKTGELLETLKDECINLISQGLCREDLEASLNRFEFSLKEIDEPRGLYRCANALSGWLFGRDPLIYMEYEPMLKALKAMLDNGGFEGLLSDLFCNQEKLVVLEAVPSASRATEKDLQEKQRARKMYKALGASGRIRLHNENARLVERQLKEDSPQALSVIPSLEVADIDREPYRLPTEDYRVGDVRVVKHDVDCGGVSYGTFMFDISGMSVENIALLSKCCGMFVGLPTKNRPVLELQREVKNKTGSLDFGVSSIQHRDNPNGCNPYFFIRWSSVDGGMSEAAELINEILFDTDFTVTETVKEYINQGLESIKEAQVSASHRLTVNCANAHFSSKSSLLYYLTGIGGMKLFKEFAVKDDMPDRLAEIFELLRSEYLVRSRLTVLITGRDKEPVKFIDALKEGKRADKPDMFEDKVPYNASFFVPSSVGCSSQSYCLYRDGISFDGSLRVSANIVAMDYLWNEVRVKGGAYDTSANVSRIGTVFTNSYRDPNPLRSIRVNKGIADYIRDFCCKRKPIDKYIIAAVNGIEPLLPPYAKAGMQDVEYLSGYTYEDDLEDRKQMLETDYDKLLSTCRVWELLGEKGATCISGGKLILSGLKNSERINF